MTVSFGLKHRTTGEYHLVPVSCSSPFNELWIPAASALELELIPYLADGSFTTMPSEFIPRLASELWQLRGYFAEQPASTSWIVERIDNILAAFESYDPAEWEYGFG